MIAHYLTFLLFQGQAMGFLISDPLGEGRNLFGTAGWKIDYGIIGGRIVWYCQVAVVVAGHVGALFSPTTARSSSTTTPVSQCDRSTGCSRS